MRFSLLRPALLPVLAGLAIAPACQRAAYVAKPRLAPVTAEPVGKALADDATVAATIAPYRQKVTEAMGTVLGTTARGIGKSLTGESPLGNFVGDLQRERASRELGQPIDLGVMTNGGLRSGLAAGPITLGAVFEVMPFENELLVLEAPGPVVQQLFSYAAKIRMAVANATYTATPAGTPADIRIGGQPFDPARTYTIAISNYLAGGGDNMKFFRDLPTRTTGVLLRDAIADHIRELTKQGRPVEAAVEGRVK